MTTPGQPESNTTSRHRLDLQQNNIATVVHPWPMFWLPAKRRTSKEVLTASTPWSNSSPSGPLCRVRRLGEREQRQHQSPGAIPSPGATGNTHAWEPSTASKVWYRNRPIAQL